MVNSIAMQNHFERNKNIKAGSITFVICACIFLMFFFIQWTTPMVEKPVVLEGIEVNIGNSDEGSGSVQPLVQGEPGETSNPDNNPTPENSGGSSSNEDNTEPDNDPDATPTTTTNKKTTSPVTNPTPTKKIAPLTPAPKPKTIMPRYSGGNGNGGNTKDGYNDSRNEGNDPNGKGDKGQPNGTPNGKNYTGPGGVSIRSGLTGRRPTRLPSFEDDFNENAKVAVDIIVNKNGKVISAIVNPKGTTTANANTRKVAVKRALEITFNTGSEDQSGTIILDMRVRG